MNCATAIVLLVVAALVGLAVKALRSGKGSCSCDGKKKSGCGGCSVDCPFRK